MTRANSGGLRAFVFTLFFAFGGITSLNDVLIPKLKVLFTLTYGDAMMVQSAFFAAYFLVSLPAAGLVHRIGYLRCAAVGLLTMAIGCLLFIPASSQGRFGLFLAALFVLAAGITTVQVVANPLISMLGAQSTASSRLTFAQAFNSLGTTIFPYVGSVLLLGTLAAQSPDRSPATKVIASIYLGLASVLVVLAAAVWLRRNALTDSAVAATPVRSAFTLLTRARFAFGVACIFLYVGAEVSIGSLLVSYLMQESVWDAAAQTAGKHVPFYWGGAMLGRFFGAYLLRRIAPSTVLVGAAGMAIASLLVSANSIGSVSGWALLSIGLFNSVMFPTIFSLASEGLGQRAAEGSGIICMAIVGGAILPYLAGKSADIWSLKVALAVPALCYAGIAVFGLFARRSVQSEPVSA